MSVYAKYFYDGSKRFDHAVTIVGYDDTVSKNKFSMKPKHDGAWIVKNSWGTHANDAGYFYLSYDQPVNAVVAYQYMAKDTYENNYFYDGSAALSEYTTSGNMTVANVFEVQKERAFLLNMLRPFPLLYQEQIQIMRWKYTPT